MQLERNADVILLPGHIYSSKRSPNPLLSVSELFHKVEPEFDRDKISYYTARKRVMSRFGITDSKKVRNEDIISEQKVVLLEWESKANEASDHGDTIHKALEDYNNGLPIPEHLNQVAKEIMHLLRKYYKTYPEFILSDHSLGIAGTTDLICQRQKENGLFDIKDYKTNLRRGIQYDSTYVKDSKLMHPNKMFLSPLEHLEFCSFTLYALKMSCYGIMLERNYNVKVGNLEIIYIFAEYDASGEMWVRGIEFIPIPYMRSDALKVMEMHKPKIDW